MSEPWRYNYPLGTSSLVLDVGGYVGQFALAALEIWGCKVISFEPLRSTFAEMQKRTAPRGEWGMINCGLGARTERVAMSVRNDSSSMFVDSEHPTEEVEIRDVVEVWSSLGPVDLMKINIEGAEYDLLERMIEAGLHGAVRFFQIQFHGCSGHGVGPVDARRRRELIEAELEKTHTKEWEVGDGIWVSWGRR